MGEDALCLKIPENWLILPHISHNNAPCLPRLKQIHQNWHLKESSEV